MAGHRTLMIGIVGSILMIGLLVQADDGVGMRICCAGAAAQLNMSDCEIFKNETPACYRDGFDADRVKYKPCGSDLCHNALYASTRFRRCLSFCPGFFNDSCKIITGECDGFVLPTEASAITMTANGTATTVLHNQTDNYQDYTAAKTRSASINPPSDEPNTLLNDVCICFAVGMIYLFGAIYNTCENE